MEEPGEPRDENVELPADPDAAGAGTEDDLWSSPQFSLKHLFIAVTLFCLVCSAIRGFNINWRDGLFLFAILGLFVWLVLNLIRLARRF